ERAGEQFSKQTDKERREIAALALWGLHEGAVAKGSVEFAESLVNRALRLLPTNSAQKRSAGKALREIDAQKRRRTSTLIGGLKDVETLAGLAQSIGVDREGFR